jgi:hypothetical protein
MRRADAPSFGAQSLTGTSNNIPRKVLLPRFQVFKQKTQASP